MVLRGRVDDNGVARALAGLADDLADPTAPLKRAADRGAQVAATEAPRGSTGRLAGGNTGRVDRDAAGAAAVVENAVPYAGYVDSGTVRTPANPFLTERVDEQITAPAVDELDDHYDTRITLRGLA